MITSSKTLDQVSSNHTDNGANMPHSMVALAIDKRRTNQSPVIKRSHCPNHTLQERPKCMLPTNEDGDTYFLDLSETDDQRGWYDLEIDV